MHSKHHDFDVTVHAGGNSMRVDFTQRGPEVVRFTVQYEIFLDGAWVPVVRFDTAHGGPHRDILNRDGEVIRQDFDWLPRTRPFKAALTAARHEIMTYARSYRSSFLERPA